MNMNRDNKTIPVGADHPWGSTPGVPSEPRLGCASVSSHGEWFFQTWVGGAVGLFALDTKHQRLWGGSRQHARVGTCWPPVEVLSWVGTNVGSLRARPVPAPRTIHAAPRGEAATRPRRRCR